MLVDTVLQQRERDGRPIRVGLIGAGSSARAIALQLGTPIPGIRLVGMVNRTRANGERALQEAGIEHWGDAESSGGAASLIGSGLTVLASDPAVLTECPEIDLIVEATGTLGYATEVVLDAIACGKHVVLVNAELDSLLGPILKAKADEAGVVITHTDGEEPGVAMTLIRYLRSVGLRAVAAGNIKGMIDHYRTPESQMSFAEKHGLNPVKTASFADGTKLSMETAILANATGFKVGRRGMYGPACGHVSEISNFLPSEQMLGPGLVDYALGAAPHTGAFVIVHEGSQLKKAQLAYYKLGNGPFYVFYTPFHLPFAQIGSTIGRAVLHNDATVCPLAGPVCEVVTVAKRDLKAGETLDGVGGFCSYGLIDNTASARAINALPIGLSEGCRLIRDIPKDQTIRFTDVASPIDSVAFTLWLEQTKRWSDGHHVTRTEFVTVSQYKAVI